MSKLDGTPYQRALTRFEQAPEGSQEAMEAVKELRKVCPHEDGYHVSGSLYSWRICKTCGKMM